MKVKIKLVFLGNIPHLLNVQKINKWDSELFEIIKVDYINIVGDSDGDEWEFRDENIISQLPNRGDADILVAVTNVPIQNNYFARLFTDNRGCITYHNMTEILKDENIPLENLLLRVLYSVSFVYRRFGNRVPLYNENAHYTHDETRGCIFDMNGVKTDVIYSMNKPQLCNSCIDALTNNPIGPNRIDRILINKVQSELKKIKKDHYYQITDLIKKHPIWAIIISSFTAIILGIIGSIIGAIIYEKFKNH
jgi:hypothetical protein